MGVWIEKAPMPTNRHDLQAIAVDGEIYAISGAGDHTVHVVEIYDVASDTWRPGPPIPTQRGWFGAARIGDEIYACGGKRVRTEEEKRQSGDDYHFEIRDSVEVLNLKTQTWSTAAPLSKPRAGLVAVVCKGKIYAVGGNSMNTEPEIGQRHLDRVEVFDPDAACWTWECPCPWRSRDLELPWWTTRSTPRPGSAATELGPTSMFSIQIPAIGHRCCPFPRRAAIRAVWPWGTRSMFLAAGAARHPITQRSKCTISTPALGRARPPCR